MKPILKELLSYYFDQPIFTVEAVPFGLTNETEIVRIGDVKYVMRIYNRHTKHAESIRLEVEITSYLNTKELSFSVPAFMKTRSGHSFVQLSDGSLGAVVTFLEGTPPEISTYQQAFEFGKIVGEMSAAFSHFQCYSRFTGASFADWYKLHVLAGHTAVQSFFTDNPYKLSDEELQFYNMVVEKTEQNLDKLAALPKQFVHHDLLVFNLLSHQQSISGVLDFDMTSLDIRFMEFAISFNHVMQLSNGSWELAEAFVKGYSSYQTCTQQELEQLQLLTDIYHIAVLHFYIGQHYSGKSMDQPFRYIINQFRGRAAWLEENRLPLMALLERNLIEKEAR